MTKNKMDFETASLEVQKEASRIITSGPSLINSYVSYLTDATGKMMRAKAVLACAMDSEGMVDPDAVKFAAAIEVLHLATLVHDDIMDDADTRRGQITLQKKSGKRNAVICGDFLLAAAIRELLDVAEKDTYKNFDFSKYVQDIALGELRQNLHNKDFRLKTFRYLSIIDGKTAALFEASYHAGSLVLDCDKKTQKLYRRLGRYTGIIFQLTDDCIDYENTKDSALKPVQSDFENGVVTMPLIHAFECEPALIEKAESGTLLKEEVFEAVKKYDGVGYTHSVAESYYERALAIIEELQMGKAKKLILTKLLNRAYNGLSK
ncbi:heptaprenyl diphosphate synthase [Pseudobutyrivibrio sp. ACV-2]|uniref:polyprenyl synthetase family protein n=1 Tax=Pseudobutyrivibrio sp. ACV-2 TaxID=1520801 RepID=UPI00089CD7E0|nr:polyprenyl synthetase family protein [Pseudobutyrivibrio sp. ACV-2]SEA64259.1 heptaprenyl diphosphate synthase [Pseudobutyrivibrio sp. ACV-2]